MINDLEVVMIDGHLSLLASTHYDGTLTRWDVDANGLTLTGTSEFDGGLRAGSYGSMTLVSLNGEAHLLTGGAANSGLQLFNLETAAGLPDEGDSLPSSALPLSGLQSAQAVVLDNGNQLIVGAMAGADGLGQLVLDPAGEVVSTGLTLDNEEIFAANITGVATAQIGDQTYVLAGSGTENGVSVWTPDASGSLSLISGIDAEDGLWVSAPTAIEVGVVDNQVFVVLAAAGSGSLSVMSLDGTGQLQVTDHLLDSLNTRFGGVTALSVVEHQGNVYVIAGGADDGISLFLLGSDGTLQARAHLADTTQMGLSNVSAISAVSAGDGIDIFVASSQEAGLTHLHFDTGPAGVTIQTNDSGEVVSGTAGMDIISGGVGDDRLSGGDGDDLLSDGGGIDRLVGGAGADTFIFEYDDTVDHILDFEVGVDQIDLSGWPMLRDPSQLEFTVRQDGIMIRYGDETLIIRSADGQPIDPQVFTTETLVGDARIPQNISPGFAGPAGEIPLLPERPDYTPYVYQPPTADPNPESVVVVPRVDGSDISEPTGIQTGSDAAEVFYASRGQNEILGRGGNDQIWGSSEADILYGGMGADRISGRAGNDQIWGGSGHDTLYGHRGQDVIAGGSGRDIISGHGGADTLNGNGATDQIRGGGGNDVVAGGSGKDQIWGGKGADQIFGGNGEDKIKGGRGNDTIFGGKKNDVLVGGSGSDRLHGGKGADVLDGGSGADQLTGGSGRDTFIFADGRDVITDFNPRMDRLQLDDRNWTGNLTPQQVVDRYATVENGNIVFDFGGNDRLTLSGTTNLNGVLDVLEIV